MRTDKIILIRRKMRDCGVWNFTTNLKVYSTEEFISEFNKHMPDDLINLLKENVAELQYYLDYRILVPK